MKRRIRVGDVADNVGVFDFAICARNNRRKPSVGSQVNGPSWPKSFSTVYAIDSPFLHKSSSPILYRVKSTNGAEEYSPGTRPKSSISD